MHARIASRLEDRFDFWSYASYKRLPTELQRAVRYLYWILQDGKDPYCGNTLSIPRIGSLQRPDGDFGGVLDHNHVTDEIRALCHTNCNGTRAQVWHRYEQIHAGEMSLNESETLKIDVLVGHYGLKATRFWVERRETVVHKRWVYTKTLPKRLKLTEHSVTHLLGMFLHEQG